MARKIHAGFRGWESWSRESGSRRAYFNVITPGSLAVSIYMFVVGAWVLGGALLGVFLFGGYVLHNDPASGVYRLARRLVGQGTRKT